MPNTPLSVMFLVDTLARGGVGAHFKMLLPSLAARGVRIRVVCLEHDRGLGAELEAQGIEVQRFALRKLKSLETLRIVRQLRHATRTEGWDIIASYLFSACLVGSAVRWGNKHIRHLLAWRDTGFWLEGIYRRGMLYASRHADILTANSDAVTEAITTCLGPHHPPVYRVPNAVQLPSATAQAQGLFHIGMVARFSHEKGQDILVKAAHLLAEKGLSFRMTLAGDGPEFPHIRELIETHHLQEIISLPGMVCDTASLYQTLHLLVAPSRSEGFSNTILEAMAHGLPIIASNIGGNPELVIPQKTGWLFPTENAAELAQCIENAIQAEEARRAMGHAARANIIASYTEDRQTDAMLAALHALRP